MLILRPIEYEVESRHTLNKFGFESLHIPIIKIEPNFSELERYSKSNFDVTIVTSQTAAKIILSNQKVVEKIKKTKVIAIGPKTKKLLERLKIEVLVPKVFSSESIYLEFREFVKNKRIAILRSNKGSPVLLKLSEYANVEEYKIYRICEIKNNIHKALEAILNKKVDAVIFTSSLIANLLMREMLRNKNAEKILSNFKEMKIIAIGTPTKETLNKYGIKAEIPNRFTFEDAVIKLKSLC